MKLIRNSDVLIFKNMVLKNLFLFILLIFFSCDKNTKEKNISNRKRKEYSYDEMKKKAVKFEDRQDFNNFWGYYGQKNITRFCLDLSIESVLTGNKDYLNAVEYYYELVTEDITAFYGYKHIFDLKHSDSLSINYFHHFNTDTIAYPALHYFREYIIRSNYKNKLKEIINNSYLNNAVKSEKDSIGYIKFENLSVNTFKSYLPTKDFDSLMRVEVSLFFDICDKRDVKKFRREFEFENRRYHFLALLGHVKFHAWKFNYPDAFFRVYQIYQLAFEMDSVKYKHQDIFENLALFYLSKAHELSINGLRNESYEIGFTNIKTKDLRSSNYYFDKWTELFEKRLRKEWWKK